MKKKAQFDSEEKCVEALRRVMDYNHPKKTKDTMIENLKSAMLAAGWSEEYVARFITSAIYQSSWSHERLDTKEVKKKQAESVKIEIELPKPKSGLRGGL